MYTGCKGQKQKFRRRGGTVNSVKNTQFGAKGVVDYTVWQIIDHSFAYIYLDLKAYYKLTLHVGK